VAESIEAHLEHMGGRRGHPGQIGEGLMAAVPGQLASDLCDVDGVVANRSRSVMIFNAVPTSLRSRARGCWRAISRIDSA